jgi:hypothetical protein
LLALRAAAVTRVTAAALLLAACLAGGGCERKSTLYLEPGKQGAPAKSAPPGDAKQKPAPLASPSAASGQAS